MRIIKPETSRPELKDAAVRLIRFATDPEEGFDLHSTEVPSAIVEVVETGEELFVWMDEIDLLAKLPPASIVAAAGQILLDSMDAAGHAAGGAHDAEQVKSQRDARIKDLLLRSVAVGAGDPATTAAALLIPCAGSPQTLKRAAEIGLPADCVDLITAVAKQKTTELLALGQLSVRTAPAVEASRRAH